MLLCAVAVCGCSQFQMKRRDASAPSLGVVSPYELTDGAPAPLPGPAGAPAGPLAMARAPAAGPATPTASTGAPGRVTISPPPPPPAAVAAPSAPPSATSRPAASTNAAARTAGSQKRPHLKLDRADARRVFLERVALKQTTVEDLRVLRRMLVEKDAELRTFQKNLLDEFGVRPDASYQFDAEKKTLFLLPAAGGAEKDRKEHRQLKDDESTGRFLRLAAARKMVLDEIQSMQWMVREKQMEWEAIQKLLSDEYAMSRDRDYEWDAAASTLYEIIPAAATERKP